MTINTKFLSLAACVLLSACDKPVPAVIELPLVKVAPLKTLLIEYQHSVPATVLSMNDSQLTAEINAVVAAIPAQVGDKVKAQQALVVLDCRDTRLMLQQAQATSQGAEARKNLAEQQFNRAEKLRTQQSIAEEELNRRAAEFNAAKAEHQGQLAAVAIAKRNVDKCTLRAPFDAVVLERMAQVGELANIGKTMIRLVESSNLQVSAHLVEREADSIENARLLCFEYKEHCYALTLKTIASAIDTSRRTQEARFVFKQETPPSGAAGRLIWIDTQPALPADFLSRRDGQVGLLLANENEAAFHPLVNIREGQPIPVSLPPETLLITEGRFGLAVGEKFKIVE